MNEKVKQIIEKSEVEKPEVTEQEVAEILDAHPGDLSRILFDSGEEGSPKVQDKLVRVFANDAVTAKVSYWEKWLTSAQQRVVDKVIAELRKEKAKSDALPLGLEKRFSPAEIKVIAGNTASIQLTFGCSKGCRFCAFDAVPGIRDQMSFRQVENLFVQFGSNFVDSKPMLYAASEPSDYKSVDFRGKEVTYKDVHLLAEKHGGYKPHVTSKNFADRDWKDFLAKEATGPRVSVYDLDPQDVFEHKAGFGDDIGFIGEGQKHIKGIGVSSREIEGKPTDNYGGIGCTDGVEITPRGIYNVMQFPLSKQFPQGQMLEPIIEISDKPPQSGELLSRLLRRSILAHSFKTQLLTPFITVFCDGKYFDVSVGEDLKVSSVAESKLESIKSDIQHIVDIHSIRMKIEEKEDETLRTRKNDFVGVDLNEFGERERATIQLLLGDFVDNNRIKPFYDERFIVPIEDKIRNYFRSQIEKIGESYLGSFSGRLADMENICTQFKLYFPKSCYFQVKKLAIGFVLRITLGRGESLVNMYGVRLGLEFVSDPNKDIGVYWPEGTKVKFDEVVEKLGPDVKIRHNTQISWHDLALLRLG